MRALGSISSITKEKEKKTKKELRKKLEPNSYIEK
jgi:hypothetical protein